MTASRRACREEPDQLCSWSPRSGRVVVRARWVPLGATSRVDFQSFMCAPSLLEQRTDSGSSPPGWSCTYCGQGRTARRRAGNGPASRASRRGVLAPGFSKIQASSGSVRSVPKSHLRPNGRGKGPPLRSVEESRRRARAGPSAPAVLAFCSQTQCVLQNSQAGLPGFGGQITGRSRGNRGDRRPEYSGLRRPEERKGYFAVSIMRLATSEKASFSRSWS
jgi:hypothetical protein